MSCRHDLYWKNESLQKQKSNKLFVPYIFQEAFERFKFKFNIPASERLSDHYLDSKTKYSWQISEAAIDCNWDMNHRFNVSHLIRYY